MSVVKPCPLCVDNGFIKVNTRRKPSGEWDARMKCEECGIELVCSGATEDDAITAVLVKWNTRAERTCEPVKKFSEESPWPRLVCSECGRELHWDDIVNEVGEDSCELQPYCGCGAKVVKS